MPKFFDRVKEWYKERKTRPVLVVCISVALLLLIISRFDPSGYVFYVFVAFAVMAIGASIADTMISYREFRKTISNLEKTYKVRQAETFGSVEKGATCFSPEDKKEIRRRKLGYIGSIIFKILFIVILIALLVRDGL